MTAEPAAHSASHTPTGFPETKLGAAVTDLLRTCDGTTQTLSFLHRSKTWLTRPQPNYLPQLMSPLRYWPMLPRMKP